MLPCARSCIGNKLNALPAACANLPTLEPLLFLYPRWFRNAANRPICSQPASARKLSSVVRSEGISPAATSIDSHEIPVSNVTAPRSGIKAGRKNEWKLEADGLRSSKHDGELAVPFTPSEPWMTEGWRPYQHNLKDKVRDKVRAKDVVTTPQKNKSHKRAVRKISANVVLELAGKLSKLRPSPGLNHTTILVDSQLLEWHTGTMDENFWRHSDGSGCMIHVDAPLEKLGPRQRVTIIGSRRAREITRKYLGDLEEQFNKIAKDVHVSASSAGSSTSSPSQQRVDQLPRPRAWSLRSFSTYVKDVVTSQAPKNVERMLYQGDETFNKVAAEVLIELFSNPELQQFQSSFALRHALRFCSTRTDIAFAARAVWSGAQAAKIVPDINCFNYEISRCIRVGNLGGVRRLIDEMQSEYILPDAATWVHLLKLLRTEEEHRQVLQVPTVQDLSHSHDATEIMVQAFIETTFEPSDDEPLCVAFLQRRMLGAFGDNWLTPAVVSTMIDLCNEAKAPKTISQILHLAASLSVELDPFPFMELFRAVTQAGWFDDMLLLMKMRISIPDARLGLKEIEMAFQAAWKQRLVNTCRVLWHYGASHGAIGHNMITKIAKETTHNVHPSAEAPKRLTASMAALIIGTDRYLESGHSQGGLDSGTMALSNALTALTQWTSVGEARHNQLQTLHVLIERDLTAWQRFAPVAYNTLCSLLEKSLALDKSWQDQDTLTKSSSVTDLLHQVIVIGLQPNQTLVKASQTHSPTVNTAMSADCSTVPERLYSPNSNSFFEEGTAFGTERNRRRLRVDSGVGINIELSGR